MKSFIIILFLSFLLEIKLEQVIEQELKELKKRIERYIGKSHLPGASIVLEKYDNITKNVKKIYGHYGIDNNISLAYIIGSNSKSFTAFGINILENEGKLMINDTIDKYLNINDYFKDNKAKAQARNTTIAQLLTHSSGLVSIADDEKDLSFPFEPNQFNYSNSGYGLLGKIIEKVSGMNYRDFIKERIFQKLEMNNSEIGADEANANKNVNLIDSFINIYGFQVKKNYTIIGGKFMIPAGFIVLSTEDMGKYLEMYLTNGNNKIPSNIVNNMFKQINQLIFGEGNDTFFYGYGLMCINYTTKDKKIIKIYSHSGSVPGYLTTFAIIPELNLAGALFTDSNDYLFMPSMELISNFYQILAGFDGEISDYYILKVLLFDLLSFIIIILGIFLIVKKIRQIIKKVNNKVTNCKKYLYLSLNILGHLIFPSLCLIFFIYLINQPGANFDIIFAMSTNLIIDLIIFIIIYYLGGIIKLCYYIYFKFIAKIDENELIKPSDEINLMPDQNNEEE